MQCWRQDGKRQNILALAFLMKVQLHSETANKVVFWIVAIMGVNETVRYALNQKKKNLLNVNTALMGNFPFP